VSEPMTQLPVPDCERLPHVHDRRFDGDDPYFVCHGCGARWDARTGFLIKPARWANPDTRLRELVLAESDKHRDAHGESCDCDLGLVLGDLSDAALATRATPTPDTKPDVEALRMALTTIAQPGCEASRWADEFPPVPDRCLDPNYIEDFDAESGERCAPCLALAVLDTTREETP